MNKRPMNKLLARCALALLLAPAWPVAGQELSELTLPPGGNGRSQRAEVSQWIGLVKISIEYHSPSVHAGAHDRDDRKGHIWGELVPYGFFDEGFGPSTATPWRAGANESTRITVSHDVKVEGKDLKAGTYALFLALDPSGPWTWIFSRASSGWGSYQYDPKDDALRVAVTPRPAADTEFLTYGFDERRKTSAVAYLQWETKRVPFKIEVPNLDQLYVDQMRKELQGWPGFRYDNWQTAAQFCADRKINLEEALVWANRAISEPFRGGSFGREDFSTLETKAAVLEAMGRDGEAVAIMERALRLPGTDAVPVFFYASKLLAAGKKEKALAVFELNRRQHPDEPFWTYLGLARGYAAVGRKPEAAENWQLALRNVPPIARPNLPAFERSLELQDGK